MQALGYSTGKVARLGARGEAATLGDRSATKSSATCTLPLCAVTPHQDRCVVASTRSFPSLLAFGWHVDWPRFLDGFPETTGRSAAGTLTSTPLPEHRASLRSLSTATLTNTRLFGGNHGGHRLVLTGQPSRLNPRVAPRRCALSEFWSSTRGQQPPRGPNRHRLSHAAHDPPRRLAEHAHRKVVTVETNTRRPVRRPPRRAVPESSPRRGGLLLRCAVRAVRIPRRTHAPCVVARPAAAEHRHRVSRTFATLAFRWTTWFRGANIVRMSGQARRLCFENGLNCASTRRLRARWANLAVPGLDLFGSLGRRVSTSGVGAERLRTLDAFARVGTATVRGTEANNGLQPTHACRSPAARTPSQARAAEASDVRRTEILREHVMRVRHETSRSSE